MTSKPFFAAFVLVAACSSKELAEVTPRAQPLASAPSAAPSAAGSSGYLTVVCAPNPCTDVSLDGAKIGASPVVRKAVAVGAGHLEVAFGEHGHKVMTVNITPDATSAVRIATDP